MTTQPTTFRIPLRDGVELRALEWSKAAGSTGTPILLIHGLASNARLWDGAARHLASLGHAVVALDLRGHGLSDKPDHGYSMVEVADDVAEVISHLEARDEAFTTPLVVGQSWGGNIVVEVAHRHHRLVRGAVAVDGGTIELSTAFPDWEECKRTLSPPALAGMSYDRLRGYIRAAHPDWSEEAIDGQMHNMERLADGTIRPWLTLERHLMVLRGLWEHVPSSFWSNLSVPILFTPAAKGDDAHTTSKRAQLARAEREIPAARVHWFEPADHDLHAQFPDRFAQVVHDSLSTGFFS